MPAEPPRRHAAVLGHPIGHSLSPVLHRAAYAVLDLPWDYDRVDVTGEQLPAFLDSRDSSWVGLSLTMPLKRDVLALLDHVDELALATGAANTVLLGEGGRRGYNTDVGGLVTALRERGAGSTPPASATVLGAGATARSAVAALARLGASSVRAYVRRPEAGVELAATAAAVGVELEVHPWVRAADGLGAEVVVSTVPHGADPLAVQVPELPGVLLDVVYDPWPTSLASAWSERGGQVASGLDLLLHQAALQVELMTGRTAPLTQMRRALEDAVRGR